jgi:hypothetical protein
MVYLLVSKWRSTLMMNPRVEKTGLLFTNNEIQAGMNLLHLNIYSFA